MTAHSTTSITGGHANAVASGAAGFMSGTDKAKLDGVAAGASLASFFWGAVAAPANAAGRYFQRTAAAVSATIYSGEYQIPADAAGSRTVKLTWSVITPLTADSITLEVYINSIATGLTATIAPSPALTGTASATLTIPAGGGRIAVRCLQSATEAQAAWNGVATVTIN